MFPTQCSPERCESCPDRVICHCFNVTESQLMEVAATHDVRSIKDIRQTTGAGDGCTCCHQRIKEFLLSLNCVPCG